MANNHASVQSLPTFAQAFGPQHLSPIHQPNNALPPIQPRNDYRVDNNRNRLCPSDNTDRKSSARKRPHKDITSSSRDDEPSDEETRPSPRLVHVKEEQDQDLPTESTSQEEQHDHQMPLADVGASNPNASPLKKRRVTVSGPPHPLKTDVRPPPDQTNSTPISPVVMGFTINRDNPVALEQVRSSLGVMNKQKMLIEQRRGNNVTATSSPSSSTNPPPPPSEERISAPTSRNSAPLRSRRSPNTNTTGRRVAISSQLTAMPPSPNPGMGQSQPHLLPPTSAVPPLDHNLPHPPISFARRRADMLGGAGKKKPADILISPREDQSSDQLQPSIQSAPPIPHAGQGAYQSSRLAMALPRLPPVLGANITRKISSNVPPTPTRLSMLRPPATAVPMVSLSHRSPPAASVPIATTLVPPTPASLHHPGYSGDKSAFLTPFEVFYDALNDSKHLKSWLGEQLQRSNALIQTLSQQQEKLNDTIEAAVEKRVSGMKSEILGLRRRIDDLEDALRNATSGRRYSADLTGAAGLKGKQPLRNGAGSGPPESYTFPSVGTSHNELPRLRPEAVRPDGSRRISSPTWSQERENRGHPPPPVPSADSDGNGSPTPYDGRWLSSSVSATRLDPPRHRESDLMLHQSRTGPSMSSPPQPYREHNTNHQPTYRDPHGRPLRHERERDNQRPGLTRQTSYNDGNDSSHPPPTPSSASTNMSQQQQQQQKRTGSRRNSIIMSPPETSTAESNRSSDQ